MSNGFLICYGDHESELHNNTCTYMYAICNTTYRVYAIRLHRTTDSDVDLKPVLFKCYSVYRSCSMTEPANPQKQFL